MLHYGSVSELEKIEVALEMLKQHVEEEKIQPFLSILEQLKDDHESESLQDQLYEAFQKLGIYQGPVLTYATSIYHLLVRDPFND